MLGLFAYREFRLVYNSTQHSACIRTFTMLHRISAHFLYTSNTAAVPKQNRRIERRYSKQ